MKEGRFILKIRKTLVPVRVMRHWNRLPREAVDVSILEVFKRSLVEALGSLVQWKVWQGFGTG